MTRGDYRRAGGNSHHQGGNHYYLSSFGSDSHGGYHETGGAGHHHSSHGGGGGGHTGGHGGGTGAMDATFIWKLSKLGRIGSSRLRFDDDFADRLNYQFSGVLMFLFIGIIGIRQYIGKPIQCWIPQEFTRGWEEYAENYCWVSNTYFSPIPKRLPPNEQRTDNLIVYYQWAPILMAIQALLFYLPCLIWRLFSNHSGFNVRRIMQMANDSNILLPEHGMKNVRFIARYMEGCIYRQRDYKRSNNQNVRGAHATASAFPYHTSYRGGLQHFTEAPHFSPPSATSTDIPPPNYSKAVPFEGPQEHRSRISSTITGLKRSNGEATASLNLGRRHKRSGLFCNRFKSGLCLGGWRGRRNRNRKMPLNPITDSPAFTGVVSVEHRDSGKCFKCSHSRNWCCGRRSGNFLVVLYFFVKVLYLINLIGQLILMEKFIGTTRAFYGIRVLLDLIQGKEWDSSGNFPRVTFCDFEAKKLGKNQMYTIQCVLPLNMFLEKIFIFLWFWHCFIGIITLVSFFNWFLRMGFPRYRLKFIRKFLKIMAVMKDTDKTTSRKFVENFLRPDGVFLIRLISMNVGDMMASDLACELWHIYRHKRSQDTEDLKYMESMPALPNVIPSHHPHHLQAPSRSHGEFGVITAPPRDKILLSMNNGNDDSIV